MLHACIALAFAQVPGPEAPVDPAPPAPLFRDATADLGLGSDVVPETVARVAFCYLDEDGAPDLVVDRQRVFLNRMADGDGFVEVAESGLLEPVSGGPVVFADLDGDGHTDALVTEVVEPEKDGWTDHGRRTRWQPGRGDGTFGEGLVLEDVEPGTCNSIAVSDVDRDGRLDLWVGGWYANYGASYRGLPSQLLLSRGLVDGELRFTVSELPDTDSTEPRGKTDRGGRPTYGSMIVDLEGDGEPELLEANYGRRANRMWWRAEGRGQVMRDWYLPDDGGAFAGDAVRHGRYPDWAIEAFAEREPPIERPPEDPFRSHGNSFDLTAGDVDRDGTLDLVVSDITHGWAGESSDRTRLLLRRDDGSSPPLFTAAGEAWSLDRDHGGARSWNQGDLFVQLADLDLDGWVDLLVSSGDYPDDQRLRYFHNEAGRGFRDATAGSGLDHDGSQQLSLADVDRDGDLDIVVGQTFFRYSAELKAGRSPAMKVFLNQAVEQGARAVVLRLFGDGDAVSGEALGARVQGLLADGTVLLRELNPIGGHAGKQNGLALHLGLGEAEELAGLVITWPDSRRTSQLFGPLGPGRYEKRFEPE